MFTIATHTSRFAFPRAPYLFRMPSLISSQGCVRKCTPRATRRGYVFIKFSIFKSLTRPRLPNVCSGTAHFLNRPTLYIIVIFRKNTTVLTLFLKNFLNKFIDYNNRKNRLYFLTVNPFESLYNNV